jgi:hypothetical protein
VINDQTMITDDRAGALVRGQGVLARTGDKTGGPVDSSPVCKICLDCRVHGPGKQHVTRLNRTSQISRAARSG